jgi:hypothetical protein
MLEQVRGGGIYRIACNRSQERNRMVENRSLENEDYRETLNRGLAPYVAKRKNGTTY